MPTWNQQTTIRSSNPCPQFLPTITSPIGTCYTGG